MELRAELPRRGHTFTQRDRRRGRRAPDRGATPARGADGGGARDARRARGPLRVLRGLRRRARRHRRRAQGDARSSSASATARTSSPPPSPPSWRTRARWSSSTTATSSSCAPTASESATSPANRSSASRVRRRLGRRGRREGRLRDLHAQGDPRAAHRARARRCRPHGRGRRGRPRRGRASAPSILRRLRRVFIVACGTSYHAGLVGKLRHRALGARAGRDRRGQRVPLPRPDRSTRRRSCIAITPVGRDRRHAGRHAPGARRRGAQVLAVTNVVGSPGHARGRRRPLHPRRAWRSAWRRPRRSPPRSPLLPARPAPRLGCAARMRRGRAASARSTSCARSRAWSSNYLERPSARAERSPSATTTSRFFLFLGRGMGFPCAWRARSSSRRSATSPPRPTPPAR